MEKLTSLDKKVLIILASYHLKTKAGFIKAEHILNVLKEKNVFSDNFLSRLLRKNRAGMEKILEQRFTESFKRLVDNDLIDFRYLNHSIISNYNGVYFRLKVGKFTK